MGIYLSDIVENTNFKNSIRFISEREFDFFSRATTMVAGNKCIYIGDEKYLNTLDGSVSMVITTPAIAEKIKPDTQGVCVADDPRGVFFELMGIYERNMGSGRPRTLIGNNCNISDSANISECGVVIGDNVIIGDGAAICPNVSIGNNVEIMAHATIGFQDFNVYRFQGKNKHAYHAGRTEIGSDVLIGPNVSVGQALYHYGVTKICDNVMVCAHSGIGHNCMIGQGTTIAGMAVINGFVSVGSKVKVHSGVVIRNGLSIGDNAVLDMGSVVIRNVGAGEEWFGNPAKRIIYPGMGRSKEWGKGDRIRC